MAEQNTDASGASYGSAKDWSTIISGVGSGISSALRSSPQSFVGGKKTAKEARRRTIANLLNSALQRKSTRANVRRKSTEDIKELKTQAMQEAAKGFIEAMQGSTKRG